MLKKILGNAQKDFRKCYKYSRECSRRFQGMLEKIPSNICKGSRECFIMRLNKDRIKGYILKYHRKGAQKFIKTSHLNENVSV